jgi:hypothetical protein
MGEQRKLNKGMWLRMWCDYEDCAEGEEIQIGDIYYQFEDREIFNFCCEYCWERWLIEQGKQLLKTKEYGKREK